MEQLPAVIHVTHWKSGSQWIRAILHDLAAGRAVAPDEESLSAEGFAFEPGKVYSPVYLTRKSLLAVPRPEDTRIFYVVRDLRDTLVSQYFSNLGSHAPDPDQVKAREAFAERSREDCFLWLINRPFRASLLQRSWAASDVVTIRYEDLLTRDVEILLPLLRDHCGFPQPEDEIRRVIEAHRFAALSGGREQGDEDATHHYRKGISGDWHRHFTPRITEAFKEKFGDLLIATGYETDTAWEPDPTLAPRDPAQDPAAELPWLLQERQTLLRIVAKMTGTALYHDAQLASKERVIRDLDLRAAMLQHAADERLELIERLNEDLIESAAGNASLQAALAATESALRAAIDAQEAASRAAADTPAPVSPTAATSAEEPAAVSAASQP